MPKIQTTELEDRGVVRVGGTDAKKLLQGLITNDLDKIEPGHALFAGLLSPQGKILFDFFVIPVADGYLIDITKDQVAGFVKRLTLYRLRADVSLDDQSSALKTVVSWTTEGAHTANDSGSLSDSVATVRDPRHPDLGFRHLVTHETSTSLTSDCTTYHAHRIQLGVPDGGRDYLYADAYPHEALYDDLNGVSFTKGCFIGQEVVSRMEHRNATKKRVVKVVGDAPLPEEGADIAAGNIALGRLGSTDGTTGLALIRVDRIKDVIKNGVPPKADTVALTMNKPNWATFEI